MNLNAATREEAPNETFSELVLKLDQALKRRSKVLHDLEIAFLAIDGYGGPSRVNDSASYTARDLASQRR
jgi:hypothetical protein